MKTVSENASRNVSDKASNKKGMRKFLQTLQPSSGDKENLVGTGRVQDSSDTKSLKPKGKTEVAGSSEEPKSVVAKINPSLYANLIIDDLTNTAGPSESYWKVIAERRRKALEDVLEQNRKLHTVVIALEEENASCKALLDQTTDLVTTLQEVLKEEEELAESEVNDKNPPGSEESNSDDCSNNESE